MRDIRLGESTIRVAPGLLSDLGALARALVRVDSRNPGLTQGAAGEAECVALLRRILDDWGFRTDVYEVLPGRPNLIARVGEAAAPRRLMFSGHLDVVPAAAEAWQHPPFSGAEVDGFVWGRGAVDMKNMVAMSLTTLLMLKRRGVPLDRDVIFAAVADEEAGSRNGSPTTTTSTRYWPAASAPPTVSTG